MQYTALLRDKGPKARDASGINGRHGECNNRYICVCKKRKGIKEDKRRDCKNSKNVKLCIYIGIYLITN